MRRAKRGEASWPGEEQEADSDCVDVWRNSMGSLSIDKETYGNSVGAGLTRGDIYERNRR